MKFYNVETQLIQEFIAVKKNPIYLVFSKPKNKHTSPPKIHSAEVISAMFFKKDSKNCICRDFFSNGNVYSGEAVTFDIDKYNYIVPHGKGSAILANGCVCIGLWNLGFLEGICMMEFRNKFCYLGTFSEGLIGGHGKFEILHPGSKFQSVEGEWKD